MKTFLLRFVEACSKVPGRGGLPAMAILAVAMCTLAPPVQAITIIINPGATLASNADALAAFNAAADQWASRIADPITVTIDADLTPLDPGVIGQASSVIVQTDFDVIRNAMVADSLGEADDGVVAALPTAAQFSALLPTGFGLNGNLSATKANLKALGFPGLDAAFGATDAIIQFNSNFAFDYDASDGVGAGLIDFETVAAHEIGHALGFVSVVDFIDFTVNQGGTADIPPRTLDLFRFGDGMDPTTLGEFTTTARNLVPGDASVLDDLVSELALSTGVFNGDGRQASHWKDNNLTATLLGIMDPTLATGVYIPVNNNDFRALDLIGYDISIVPLPGALYLFAFGLLGLGGLARRKWYGIARQQ